MEFQNFLLLNKTAPFLCTYTIHTFTSSISAKAPVPMRFLKKICN